MSETELWKPASGMEDKYQVSSFGRVKSMKPRRPYLPGHIKQQWVDGNGYKSVSIYIRGSKTRNVFVHRLVAETFLGHPLDGFQCAHLDGNPGNNNVGNLAWVTQSENERHKEKHGTTINGEKNHRARLRDIEVMAIRELCSARKISRSTIARCFDASVQTICQIHKKQTRWFECPV